MARKIFYSSLVMFVFLGGIFLWRRYSLGEIFSQKTTEVEIKTTNLANENSSVNDPSGQKKSNTFLSENEKSIQKLIEGPVLGPVLAADEKKILYYANQNIMQADLDGKNRSSLGAYPFSSVEEVFWSSQKNWAILKDAGGYVFFNLEKEEFIAFPQATELLFWGNLNGQFFYEYQDLKTGRRILDASFSLTGKPWEEIVDLPYGKAQVALHPFKNEGLFFPDPKISQAGEIFKINFSTKEKTKFLDYYHGMDFLISPSGKKILESYRKKDGRISLGLVDWETGSFQDLNFPTSVKKCVWTKNEKEVLCAAILSAENVVLPEDWENKRGSFGDIFWRINVQNGKQTRLLELGTEEKTDAEKLFLDKEEKNLFFLDRLSGGLFKIVLAQN